MTEPLSDTRLAEIREAGRAAARQKLAGLFSGRLGEEFADEIADAILDAALPGVLTEPVQPSPEHQAVYLDDHDQVWCDYPTVPVGDDVLPLVWASEQAQSRGALADGGNRLRVIGWCR